MVDFLVTNEASYKVANYTFWSLDEFADYAAERPEHGCRPRGFNGNVTLDQAVDLAKHGWNEHLSETLDIAESAVSLCEQEHEQFTFAPVYDVAGGDVDVARFLAGEPECMVDYPLTVTSKAGRVITLCASMAYSSAISSDVIVKRGQVIVALAIALSKLGHSIELWADISGRGKYGGGDMLRGRVLVKGADGVLDAERILFAYSHPAMLRQLGIVLVNASREEKGCELPGLSGTSSTNPRSPKHDLADGAIYLPEVESDDDLPDAHEALTGYLRELGLIESYAR